MTGSALFDFLIALVVLVGVVALFFYAIEGISDNATFVKIARLAVGVAAVVAFLFAVKAVFFGGGGAGPSMSASSLLQFAAGVIIVLVVIFICKWFIGWAFPTFLEPAMLIIGGIALVVLLLLAAQVFFGGGLDMSKFRPRSGLEPNRAVAAAAAVDLPRLLT